MTNPSNMVRVRARNGGRASVYEANGWAQAFSSGLVEGHGVTQNTSADMKVLVGGSATNPDVALAQNPAGYKIALDIVSQQAITLTAPASNSRISAIVAYTDDLSLATTEDTVTGSPASCGLIVVNGTASANPTAPTDAQIRTAITSDGATGSQACYCVIATVLVASGTSVITNSLITTNMAGIAQKNINFNGFSIASSSSLGMTTSGGSYTATGFGVVQIQAAVASNQYVTCKINNVEVVKAQGGDAAFTWIPITLPVAPGDVVDVTSSDNGGSAQVVDPKCFFYAF